jgi:hypothetical protein
MMWWEEPLDCIMEGVFFVLKIIAFLLGAAIPLGMLAVLIWSVHWLVTRIPFPIGV